MRVFRRRVVDLDREDLDISSLPGWEKIKTSIKYYYRHTKLYIGRKDEEANKLLEIKMGREEKLKNVLLYQFNKELNDHSSVNYVTFLLARQFSDILSDVLLSVDFLAYKVEVFHENPDYLLSFPDMPIKIGVRKQ